MAPKTVRRVSLACIPCRNRHVRCDAVRPTCLRCSADSTSCYYTQSRRIGRQRPRPRHTSSSASRASLPRTNCGSSSYLVEENERPQALVGSEFVFTGTQSSAETAALVTSHDDFRGADELLQLYYQYFHDAHPFVLPWRAFQRNLSINHDNMHHLKLTMQYVGSFYSRRSVYSRRSEKSDTIAEQAWNALSSATGTSGFLVQSFLLMAIAKSMCNNHQESRQILDRAIDKAKSIGMHTQEFAMANGELDPLLEESWRRTWWMLYITDANFAVIRREFRFSLSLTEQNVDLPCDEEHFRVDEILPPPDTLAEYRNREYSIEEKSFSSFAYLIDATAIYNQVLLAAIQFGENPQSESLCSDSEAAIAGWFLFLPNCKQELTKNGYFSDELLFQAHMMMHTASVFIHRPLSALRYSSVESISTCAPPPPPPDPLSPQSCLSQLVHSAKVIEAIRKQNQCLLLPVPAVAHSPSIICMVACGTIAYLAACRFSLDDVEVGVARDRIRVSMGILKCYEDIWPRTRKILLELKLIARSLLSLDQTMEFLAQSQDTNIFQNESLSLLYPPGGDDLEQLCQLELPWNTLENVSP